MAILISLSFLVIGFSAGFLGQNSRMCFVGGFRDFLLVKDTALLEGLMSFFVASWLINTVFKFAGLIAPDYPTIKEALFSAYGLISVIGGLFVGFVSTLSGGCPLRHHVLLGQGRLDSGIFFIGFYAGIIIYYKIVVMLLKALF
jgi:uncharacterized protein